MSGLRRSARTPLRIVADEYTLEKCLAQGGRSDVWAAVRPGDGREVVLKAYAADRGKRLADTWAQTERAMLRAAATPSTWRASSRPSARAPRADTSAHSISTVRPRSARSAKDTSITQR